MAPFTARESPATAGARCAICAHATLNVMSTTATASARPPHRANTTPS